MKCFALVALSTFVLSGCQSESTSEPVVEATEIAVEVTPVAFNVDGAPTAEIHVPDMMCQFACPPAVKKVLTKQVGVKDVKIDFESRTATVAIDDTLFDGEAAVAALVDYQFGNAKLMVTE